MERTILPYIFFGLFAANVLMFGFYTFVKPVESQSEAVKIAKSQLNNPVTFTNVTNEVPPLIGTKK